MKRILCACALMAAIIAASCSRQHVKPVPDVKWDPTSIIIDGKRVLPVMGEIHYSRVPADEWEAEVNKMKLGGLSMIATYVFWNHHEETEGQFDWTGQRNLREFLLACQRADMPVVLRIGPFCHGEARNGGIPDYIYEKGIPERTEDPAFMEAVKRLYSQIAEQVDGLLWSQGGPVLGVQLDNEYGGPASYLLALKRMAQEVGLNVPIYTRTGWPELQTPMPYGEMIPLFGDYADGFWERSIEPATGNYYKAFNFKSHRSSDAIATEQLSADQLDVKADNSYPYCTCELGGGMTNAYHRRPYIYPADAYSLAMVKLGSGSNLLGYYMYHGGSNPESHTGVYLNEDQDTPGINYNDLPHISYEFQAPLGEFGQVNPHFYLLRKLHLFLADYGEMLAPMQPVFPAPQDLDKADDQQLRWAYRTDGESAFVFVNNYERLQQLSPKEGVTFDVCGITFPSEPITIPAGAVMHFPVKIGGIDYATAQLIACRDGKVYMEQIAGIPTEISVDGVAHKNLMPKGVDEPVVDNIYLLDSDAASRLFLPPGFGDIKAYEPVNFAMLKEAGEPRTIGIGAMGVAKQPTDADFEAAAIYEIDVPAHREGKLIDIDYVGDCARLYADGKLVADNFYNGRTFQYALWRLPVSATKLELRILPLQPDAPIYLPAEANRTPGAHLASVTALTL